MLPPTMTDIALTAKWETAFGLVESGQVPLERLLEQERMFVTMLVDRAREVAKQYATGGPATAPKAPTAPARPAGNGGKAAGGAALAPRGATYATRAR